MISLGHFEGSELSTVAALSFLIMPSERLGEGVQVECSNGQRVWKGATRHGAFRIVGGAANFPGQHLLHLRSVRDAESMLEMSGSVDVVIDGEVVRVTSGDASGELPVAIIPPDTALFEIQAPTVAEISVEGLRHVLWSGTHDPAEGFSEDERDLAGPTTVVRFLPSRLELSTSFAEVSCADTTSSWITTITGPLGEVGVHRWALKRLFGNLHSLDDTTFRLSADVSRGGALYLEGESWRVALVEAPTRAGRYYEELRDRLNFWDALSAEHEDGRLAAEFAGVEMVLQLLDGRMPIVRATVHVVGDVERTPDLLSEIDQQNEGRAFTKFFMSGSSVFASIDIRCTDIANIDQYLRILADDSKLLGSFLAALGAKAASPTLW
ncbi:MAG: hypothetical protein RLZZ254_1088 [Actinomycetota bacterium]